MKKFQLAALACGLLTTLSVYAADNAASPSSSSSDSSASSDVTGKTMAQLHAINQDEIKLGQLALRKATDKDVRKFGSHLISDHKKADSQLTSLCKKQKIDLNASMEKDEDSKETMSKLESQSKGREWDISYLNAMVDGHQKAIDLVSGSLDQIQEPQTKSWLTKLVPQLQQHRSMASQLLDRLNSQRTPAAASDSMDKSESKSHEQMEESHEE